MRYSKARAGLVGAVYGKPTIRKLTIPSLAHDRNRVTSPDGRGTPLPSLQYAVARNLPNVLAQCLTKGLFPRHHDHLLDAG